MNYRKAHRVEECLHTLRRQSVEEDCHVWIIDNSEDDREAQFISSILQDDEHLIVSPCNIGYTKAVNLGVKSAGPSDYILLISPDIIIEEKSSIENAMEVMEHNPSIGILATLQHNDDGSKVEIARNYPSLYRQILRRIAPRWFSELGLLDPLYSNRETRLIYVDWVQSSFMMMRRVDWNAIGGLNERYFLFMSDIEICRRVHNMGKLVAVSSHIDVRADGIRASQGGLLSFISNRALHHHVGDALIYYLIKPPLRPVSKN